MARPSGRARPVRFDREFLQKLEDNPAAVLRQYGIEPTSEIVDAIREMDFAPLYRIAEAFPTALPPVEPMIGVEHMLAAKPPVGTEELQDQVGLIFP